MAITLTNEMINGARTTEKLTGVPASITLAQIIEESSGKYEGGMSLLALKGNNLFGVKSYSSNSNDYITMKDGNGKLQTWKKYDSVYDSIIDHANIITNERYSSLYKNAKSVEDYALALQNGGYAGNSTTYANKLMTHIEERNLNQYNLSGSNEVVNTSFSNNSNDLKWYGDIFKYILIVLIAVVGVFFVIKSLDINIIPTKEKIINKVMKE